MAKTEIKIMCDYSAGGIWEDGMAAAAEDLIPFGVSEEDATELQERLDDWQETFESFNMWDPDVNIDELIKTTEYQKWSETGYEIAAKVKELLIDREDVEVVYFDDTDNSEYIVQDAIVFEKFDRRARDADNSE